MALSLVGDFKVDWSRSLVSTRSKFKCTYRFRCRLKKKKKKERNLKIKKKR